MLAMKYDVSKLYTLELFIRDFTFLTSEAVDEADTIIVVFKLIEDNKLVIMSTQ